MQTVKKYKIFCTTEGIYVYGWFENIPLKCPNNVDHSINTSLTRDIDCITTNNIYIYMEIYKLF